MKQYASTAFLLFTALSLLTTGCGAENETTGPWNEADDHRWQALAPGRSGRAGFRTMTGARTGVTFANTVSDDAIVENRHRMNGSGVALGDVNGDGRIDIYLAGMDRTGALYLNAGKWNFIDATMTAGLGEIEAGATGVTLVDLDGDRDLDLFITFLERRGEIFLNNGTGRFESAPVGRRPGPGSMTATFADLDSDGDLDAYVTRYQSRAARDSLPPDQLLWNRTVLPGPDGPQIAPGFENIYRLRMVDSSVLRLELGSPDALFNNVGNGRFDTVPLIPPVVPTSDPAEPLLDWGLTARLVDFTGDGTPDLYVCNDFESPDYIWAGDGSGGFDRIVSTAVRTTSHSSMAVADADIDRDGHIDLFVADMLGVSAERRLRDVQSEAPIVPPPGDVTSRVQSGRNTLLMGRADGTWSEAAWQYGVAASGWTWAVSFVDVDLDGWEDLLLTTGHRFNVLDADAQLAERDQIRRVRSVEAYRRLILDYPDLPLPNRAYRNIQGRRFEDVTDIWGFGMQSDISHGFAIGDLDGDGDLDVVVNRMDAPAGLYRNLASAPRLAVRLRGRAPNTAAIGARVRLITGDRVQERRLVAGGGYLSSSVPEASFAIEGDSLRLEVQWPSGHASQIDRVQPGRRYELFEPEQFSAADDSISGDSRPKRNDPYAGSVDPSPGQPSTWFVSHSVGQHIEAPFDDRSLQPLIIRRLSREGPRALAADLNGDGIDDILIGAGRGGRPEVLIGRTTGPPVVERRAVAHLPVAHGDWTDLTAVRIGSELHILAAVSGYESETASEIQVFVWRANRIEVIDRLVLGAASVGAIAVADIDADGHPDLFTGNRFLPGAYPTSAPSMLYRYEGGSWMVDSVASTPFAEAGAVSSAAFGDSDGDGFPDLALATEWGPIRFYQNDGFGRLVEQTSERGLADMTGLWNAVEWVDVNMDGRDDLVALNRGWNSPAGRDGARRLYYGPFATDGLFRAIEAQPRTDLGGWGPIHPFYHALSQWPELWRYVSRYSDWSVSTMDSLPGIFRAEIAEVNTMAHMILLNDPGGFVAVPLPDIAQRAPSHGAAVLDANLDGFPDLVIAQNDFGVLPEGGARYDAGRGLLLLGDGDGGFEAVPGKSSNIRVYGDQRGVVTGDFDGNGLQDVAITQNGASTVVHLRTKEPVDCKPGNIRCSP